MYLIWAIVRGIFGYAEVLRHPEFRGSLKAKVRLLFHITK
jgi:hypothetical protein